MATQYTAGLVQGQKLTAAIMNQIGAVWEDYNPNFRPGAGVWFVAPVQYARYARIQKIVFGEVCLNITSVGTGNNGILFDLPIPAKNGNPGGIGSGREAALTGNTFNVWKVNTTTGSIRFYNNGDIANGNYSVPFFFMYEAA
jgi:hypothetical protein